MNPPLPPEREGTTRQRRAGEGLSPIAKDHAYDPLPTARSRDLRNNPTLAERKLWTVLGNRKLSGVRFNRQVVIRPYICDLVARSAKLVIEIDGGQHGNSIGYDKTRTAFLKSKGYRVLRFWNNDVLGNLDGVVATISEALNLTPPARAGGEEERSDEGEGRSSPDNNLPSPPRLRRSSPPAPAGGVTLTPPARAGGEEERSDEGEGRSSSEGTGPPPLAFGESTPPAPAGGGESST